MKLLSKQRRLQQRRRRTRAKLAATQSGLPRLSVFRSNAHIYAQIIDDAKGVTLAAASDKELTDKQKSKTDAAAAVGKLIAEKAAKAKIEKVVFDRGGVAYHGRVKALADAARENNLKF